MQQEICFASCSYSQLRFWDLPVSISAHLFAPVALACFVEHLLSTQVEARDLGLGPSISFADECAQEAVAQLEMLAFLLQMRSLMLVQGLQSDQ